MADDPTHQTDGGSRQQRAGHDGSVKETVISLIISLAMALIAKTYVLEAYRIPTGSMAPTLLGDHIDYVGPQTGHRWSTEVWYAEPRRPGEVRRTLPVQGVGGNPPPNPTDPMLGHPYGGDLVAGQPDPRLAAGSPRPVPKRTRAGDRILVQKYLYWLFPPERYDVVVFKNPSENVDQNFIKRLVGLPNEAVWLVDGDVFVAPAGSAWDDVGAWSIARKSIPLQQSLWRTIFSSEHAPRDPMANLQRYFFSPWQGGDGWEIADTRVYAYEDSGPTVLAWDTQRWPIDDWEPYNDSPEVREDMLLYPVADVRLRAGIEPQSSGLEVTARIVARRHTFEATIVAGRATLRVRRDGGDWRMVAEADAARLPTGRVTDVELWHADQRLVLVVDGDVVLEHAYDWSPRERLEQTCGIPANELTALPQSFNSDGPQRRSVVDPRTYTHGEAQVEWRFNGAPLRMHRVGLDRDIFYRPSFRRSRGSVAVGRACHRDRIVHLGDDHFFMLGDNSAASLDGRGWDRVDPWVAAEIDSTVGVVHRDLILGKAFFVYFPAPYSFGVVPVPDVGNMRLIQ